MKRELKGGMQHFDTVERTRSEKAQCYFKITEGRTCSGFLVSLEQENNDLGDLKSLFKKLSSGSPTHPPPFILQTEKLRQSSGSKVLVVNEHSSTCAMVATLITLTVYFQSQKFYFIPML